MNEIGYDRGFTAIARVLEQQYRLGAISLTEYRMGLRQAGQVMQPDDVVFAPPPPLPPDLVVPQDAATLLDRWQEWDEEQDEQPETSNGDGDPGRVSVPNDEGEAE